jgi:CheY-like chemotaxis protein
MPNGGTLHVHVKNRLLTESEVLRLPAGKMVEITVIDHGIGIPQDHLHRVFDPYFSDKKGGRGMGLAIVYSVIVRHGGHVHLDSEVGLGTSVTFFLPATEKEPERAERAPESMQVHTGTVLLMDDEEIVREASRAMLEDLGYTVETARDGREMLERYREALDRRAPYDLVIMDLTIPGGMGGQEAIKELLAMDVHARAIVSSGYSNDPVMANYRSYGFIGVVPKPYRLDDLSRALKQIPARVGLP